MTKQTKSLRHRKITQETVEQMTFLLEHAFVDLTAWEKGLLKDRFEAFKKYGFACVCTPPQQNAIEEIFIKHRLIQVGSQAFAPKVV